MLHYATYYEVGLLFESQNVNLIKVVRKVGLSNSPIDSQNTMKSEIEFDFRLRPDFLAL